jgi:hypothetical protein
MHVCYKLICFKKSKSIGNLNKIKGKEKFN